MFYRVRVRVRVKVMGVVMGVVVGVVMTSYCKGPKTNSIPYGHEDNVPSRGTRGTFIICMVVNPIIIIIITIIIRK